MSVPSRVAFSVFGAAAGVAATADESWIKSILALSKGALRASISEGTIKGSPDSSLQIAALSASVQTLSSAVQGALQAQRGGAGSGSSVLLLVGAPLLGVAWYLKGMGWVTLGQMKEQLEGVRVMVCATLEGVKVQLLERMGVIEKQGVEMAVWRQEQAVAIGQLSAEVHSVHETVGHLEKRLEGVEADVSRSARGVELLCEFVASANSSSGGPGRTLQDRLHTFTGISHNAEPDNPPLPSTWGHSLTASSSSSGLVSSVLSGRLHTTD